MKAHNLKLNSKYFFDVKYGDKTFEIRKNDRDFAVGDLLVLQRYDDGEYRSSLEAVFASGFKAVGKPVDEHQADSILAKIIYMTDYEQKDDYVVLGIALVKTQVVFASIEE